MKYIVYRSSSASGPLQKLAGAVAAVAIAGALLVFSSVVLVVLVLVAAIGGIWLWWKTRHVRRMMRQMQDQMNRAREAFETGATGQGPYAGAGPFARQQGHAEGAPGGGIVIEGEAVRVDEPRQRLRR